MEPDHYGTLGVTPDASTAEIRAAYLRLMRAHHPDRRPHDNTSGALARDANASWRVLRDARSRSAYDRARRQQQALHEATLGVSSDIALARATAAAMRSYSTDQAAIRRDFSAASLRLGVAVFLVGILLLALTT